IRKRSSWSWSWTRRSEASFTVQDETKVPSIPPAALCEKRATREHTVVRTSMALTLILSVLLFGPLALAPVAAQGTAPMRAVLLSDRTVLPIPEPMYPHSTVFDVRNATPPPRFEVKAPAGAPNVLIVLIDDMGFGQSSAFGGPIRMPTVERLANNGLRYNE